jgi:hypothetical protein
LASDNLGSMWLNGCGLTDLDISGCTVSNGLYITAQNNTGLSQAVIEDLLAFLDGEGITGGTLDITNTVTPNAASLAYITSLQGKSWTITYDEDEITVQFSSTASSGAEATTPATIAVVLSGALSEDVTVAFILGGTATAGTDYTAPDPLSLTIPAGATSANISIPITNDSVDEGNETIILTLTSVTAGDAVLGTNTVHTYTIIEDDTTVDGLLAYFPCNEGSGSTLTDTYNDNVLTGANGLVWATGHGDNTYSLDPYTVQYRIANGSIANLTGLSAMSMCWWVYSPAAAIGAVIYFTGGLHITKSDSNQNEINGFNCHSSTMSLNAWHHVALVLNGSAWQWYIDGVADNSGTYSITYPTANNAQFGGYDGDVYRYRGYINDFYLFNRVITADEVIACMNNTLLS